MKVLINRRNRNFVLILFLICAVYAMLHHLLNKSKTIVISMTKADFSPGIQKQSKLLNVASKDKSVLNVYVVEEHHEVIPYWFNAARDGLIPNEANTLIHIDGHSDMASPTYFPGFPFFKFPSKGQHRFLMQENDMFIMSAAITGLIGKIVWIWPSWDKVNHDNFTLDMKVEVGLTTKELDEKIQRFCMCTKNETCQRECVGVLNEYIEDEFTEMVEIDPKYCNIKRTFMYEEIREEEAVDKLTQSLSYLGSQGTILDIDEDYYGSMYAIRPVLEAGLTEEKVNEIADLTEELFCPKDAAEEFRTDQLLIGFLNEILKLHCKKGLATETGHDCLDKMFIQSFTKRAKKKVFENNEYLLCSEKLGRQTQRIFMGKLVKEFLSLTNAQNKALQYVGFCMTTTLLSFNLTNTFSFRTCHGSNTPDSNIIIEHQTNLTEIRERTKSLRNILSVVKKTNPKIVTLCRSMRDAYTPRKYFSKIENDVIESLRHIFGNTKVAYDSDLLGGRKGRSERYGR